MLRQIDTGMWNWNAEYKSKIIYRNLSYISEWSDNEIPITHFTGWSGLWAFVTVSSPLQTESDETTHSPSSTWLKYIWTYTILGDL